MKLVEIRDEADWDRLESGWNELLEASASKTIFLTWEWLRSWWSAYGRGGGIWILAAYDDAGVLRGIAPLRRNAACRYRQTVSSITFVGDGSNVIPITWTSSSRPDGKRPSSKRSVAA